ncbi:MAG: carbon storage regulator CsrA [Oscillospiraceae bacterium]|nr:carbon storage regulator CsrA [Oscillospiraceae bacterium]
MLILRRKSGESIVIGDNIHVTVLDINEGSVRLAIDAPKSIPILRSELLQAADANRDAAASRATLQLLSGKSSAHAAGKTPPWAVRAGVPAPTADTPVSTETPPAEPE